jgi:hypothetical protein
MSNVDDRVLTSDRDQLVFLAMQETSPMSGKPRAGREASWFESSPSEAAPAGTSFDIPSRPQRLRGAQPQYDASYVSSGPQSPAHANKSPNVTSIDAPSFQRASFDINKAGGAQPQQQRSRGNSQINGDRLNMSGSQQFVAPTGVLRMMEQTGSANTSFDVSGDRHAPRDAYRPVRRNSIPDMSVPQPQPQPNALGMLLRAVNSNVALAVAERDTTPRGSPAIPPTTTSGKLGTPPKSPLVSPLAPALDDAERTYAKAFLGASGTMPTSVKIMMGQELGSGTSGAVYKGFDKIRGVDVAVKVAHVTESAASMAAEFQRMTELQHHHIVRVFDFTIVDDKAQIVMEWMPSGSIDHILRQSGRLHELALRRFFREALLGLSYLHENGWLHRDVKPGNMLVSGSGTVKLSDFGTSKLLPATANTATASGTVGSPAYMAPEVIREGRTSKGSDIWALACSVVQMATARGPWSHLPLGQQQSIPLMFHIGTAAPPNHHPVLPARLSPPLAEVLKTCFAHSSADRPTAAALLELPYFAFERGNDAGDVDVYGMEPLFDFQRALSTTPDAAETPQRRQSTEEFSHMRGSAAPLS